MRLNIHRFFQGITTHNSNSMLRSWNGRTNHGFTLVEMMVAVALFSMVMVIAATSLIAVVDASRRAQAIQSVIDNLDFALDDMSRTIRTGTSYHCGNTGSVNVPQDCGIASQYIALEGTNGNPNNSSDQIVYQFLASCGTGFVGGCIKKSIDSGVTFFPITSQELNISNTSFYVTGSCPQISGVCTSDSIQPRITMIMSGNIKYKNKVVAEIKLETNMTQRNYDI